MKKLFLLMIIFCNTSQVLHSMTLKQQQEKSDRTLSAIDQFNSDRSSNDKFNSMISSYGELISLPRKQYAEKSRAYASARGIDLNGLYSSRVNPYAVQAPAPAAPTSAAIAPVGPAAPAPAPSVSGASEEPGLRVPSAPIPVVPLVPVPSGALVSLVPIVPGGSLMIVDPSAAIGAILPEGPAVAPVNGVSPYSAMGAPERANYALVLGLSGSDLNDLSVIRKAFRDLSKQWHPDRAPAANQKDLYTATFQIIEDAYKKALNNAGKVSVPAAGSPLSMADTSKLKVIEQQVQAVANNAANMDPATIQSQLQPSVNNFNDVIRSVSPTADRTFINRIYRQIFNIVAPAYAKKQAQQRGQQLTLPAPVVTASTSPKDWEVLQLALTRVKEKNEDFYQPFTELYESIAKKVAQTPITDQAHLTLLAHAKDEYDKLKAPQAPQLTGTYAPGKPGAIMPGNIPAPQLRPLKLTDSEWNRLRELNKLADRNQLDSSSDKAEFSRLIDKAKMVLHNNPAAVKEDDKALIASATENWNMMLS